MELNELDMISYDINGRMHEFFFSDVEVDRKYTRKKVF